MGSEPILCVDIATWCIEGLSGRLGGVGNIASNPIFVDRG